MVAPLLHLLPVADEEVSVTEPPLQNVNGPDTLIEAIAGESPVTTKVVVSDTQPEAFFAVIL